MPLLGALQSTCLEFSITKIESNNEYVSFFDKELIAQNSTVHSMLLHFAGIASGMVAESVGALEKMLGLAAEQKFEEFFSLQKPLHPAHKKQLTTICNIIRQNHTHDLLPQTKLELALCSLLSYLAGNNLEIFSTEWLQFMHKAVLGDEKSQIYLIENADALAKVEYHSSEMATLKTIAIECKTVFDNALRHFKIAKGNENDLHCLKENYALAYQSAIQAQELGHPQGVTLIDILKSTLYGLAVTKFDATENASSEEAACLYNAAKELAALCKTFSHEPAENLLNELEKSKQELDERKETLKVQEAEKIFQRTKSRLDSRTFKNVFQLVQEHAEKGNEAAVKLLINMETHKYDAELKEFNKRIDEWLRQNFIEEDATHFPNEIKLRLRKILIEIANFSGEEYLRLQKIAQSSLAIIDASNYLLDKNVTEAVKIMKDYTDVVQNIAIPTINSIIQKYVEQEATTEKAKKKNKKQHQEETEEILEEAVNKKTLKKRVSFHPAVDQEKKFLLPKSKKEEELHPDQDEPTTRSLVEMPIQTAPLSVEQNASLPSGKTLDEELFEIEEEPVVQHSQNSHVEILHQIKSIILNDEEKDENKPLLARTSILSINSYEPKRELEPNRFNQNFGRALIIFGILLITIGIIVATVASSGFFGLLATFALFTVGGSSIYGGASVLKDEVNLNNTRSQIKQPQIKSSPKSTLTFIQSENGYYQHPANLYISKSSKEKSITLQNNTAESTFDFKM